MGIVVFLAFGILMAILANRKGYSPFAWFFAAGLLGLIILAILPNVKELPPEEASKKAQTGNIVGGVISGIAILASIGLLIVSSS